MAELPTSHKGTSPSPQFIEGLAGLLDQIGRILAGNAVEQGLHPVQWSALRYFAVAGAVRGRFTADVRLADLDPPNSVVLSGGLHGPLGASSGMGKVTLTASGESTRIDYDYEVVVTGKVVAIGGRMLDGASRVLVEQFFRRLIAQIEGQNEAGNSAGSWLSRLLKILGVGR